MVSNKEISEMLKARREGKEPKKEMKTINKSKKCTNCGMENKENAKFCVGCGKSFEVELKPEDIKGEQNTKICPSCKSEIPQNAKFCVICGQTQSETTESPESLKEEVSNKSVIKGEEIKVQEYTPQLIVQELTLSDEGLKLNKNITIEGLEDEVIKYEFIENINLKEESELQIIEIETAEGNIKIKGVDPDSGSEFVDCMKKRIDKPELGPESADKIGKAKELLDIGAISEEEFQNIKNKILENK